IAVLALMRAGNTPTTGPYAQNVAKGVDFIFERIEKADKDSLYVTDVRGTQLQSKIGPYVDTFLSSLVLAELKGKAGERDKRLVACLDKTVGKIVKNQRADGQFAGNEGWAPVLSQGLAGKGLARARMAGAKEVSDEVLARVQSQADGGQPAASLGSAPTAPPATGAAPPP